MTDFSSMVLVLLQVFALLYWCWQTIRVLLTRVEVFGSYIHKLAWFLVVAFIPVVGAICFSVWHHRIVARDAQESADAMLRSLAHAHWETKKTDIESSCSTELGDGAEGDDESPPLPR